MKKMTLLKETAIIAVFLLLFSFCFADSYNIKFSAERTALSITENSYTNLKLTNTLAGAKLIEINTKNGVFNEIVIPEYGKNYNIGKPQLPVLRKLIEVPIDAQIEVNIIDYQVDEYQLNEFGAKYALFPVQPSLPKNIDQKEILFQYDKNAYQKNLYYGEELVSVEKIGIMRGISLGRISIAPVQYNPVRNTIKVFNNIKIEILFHSGNIAKTIAMKKNKYSPFFDVITNNIINYKQEMSKDQLTKYPVKYVIVSDSTFETALQPFIEWKNKKGFYVISAYTNDPNVGNTTSSISAYLEDLYNQGTPDDPAPSFVLLVGDVAQIPAFSSGGHITDLYYCEYTGDYLPELFYGRFSANNLTELQPQIDKTLEYEQYLMPDPSFLNEVVMISGVDAGHAPTWGNGQINYGTDLYFNTAHGITSHTYLYPESGSSSAQIIQNVSNGVAYANYTAHGSSSGWANPSFSISDIATLQNQSKYPLMVGNACSTNEFGDTCFGEALLRAENKGAIGYIGSSSSTYWDEDYWWAVGYGPIIGSGASYDSTGLGAYDRTFHDHGEPEQEWYVTQDAMIYAGNLAVTESGSSLIQYYWEVYHLMGDPSLMVYFSEPEPMIATYEGLLPIGAEEFYVETEPYSYVAISMNGELHGSALADEFGNAMIHIEPFTIPGYADIVITKQNRQPFFGTVPVQEPAVIISPDSIWINQATDVNITVYKSDGITPMENVIVYADGPGLSGILDDTTNADGQAALNITSIYGYNIHIIGYEQGNNYDTFEEELPVVGGDNFTNPDLMVFTDFGLQDTFALNLPATLSYTVEETDCQLLLHDTGLDTVISTTDDSIIYTPTILNTIIRGIILKDGYNIYMREFPVITVFGSVSGIVTDSEYGNPVYNAEVRFYEQNADPSSQNPVFSTITNADGFYEITDEYPVNHYDIYIDILGYEAYLEEDYFLGYGHNIHNIMINPLPNTSAISGNIHNSSNEGISATLTYSDSNGVYKIVNASASGDYSVTLLNSTYYLNIYFYGYIPFDGEIEVNDNAVHNYKLGTPIFFDDCENGLEQWTTNHWGDVEDKYVSPTHSFDDSPGGQYQNYANNELELAEPLDLSGYSSMNLYFWTQWSIEEDWDYAQVLASTNDTTIVLSGEYTHLATGSSQPIGEPIYDGMQTEWVYETISLGEFVEKDSVYLKFILISDNSETYDGWYIDDIVIGNPDSSYEDTGTPVDDNKAIIPMVYKLYQNYPNPFNPETTIRYALPRDSKVSIRIYNIRGQLVRNLVDEKQKAGYYNIKWFGIDDKNRQMGSGIYLYKLSIKGKSNNYSSIKKMVLLK